jgi:hypothetical protein
MKGTYIFLGGFIKRLIALTWFVFACNSFGGNSKDGDGGFAGPETFFGADTNGAAIALYINQIISTNNAPIRCTPILKSGLMQTNGFWLWFPPLESCYQLTLLDEHGNSVLKTPKGKLLGKPITEPLMVKVGGVNIKGGYKGRKITASQTETLSDFAFVLQDYFILTNSGKYHLIFSMRAVRPKGGSGHDLSLYTTNLPIFNFPPVESEITITYTRK